MGLGAVTCTLGNPFYSLDRKGQCKCGQLLLARNKRKSVAGVHRPMFGLAFCPAL